MLLTIWRITVLLLLSGLSLQLFFAARIALMNVLDPSSTSFQRSEFVRILVANGRVPWSQQWVPGSEINNSLRRAVIASEDANFVDHNGVEWDALENAWRKNMAAKARAEKRQAEALARHQRAVERARKRGRPEPPPPDLAQANAKVIGGSTITQQLAKNLFLSSERNFLRKGQEFAITFMLEGLLTKDRILDIYLNNVEWGEGVFGAQAAARHYFRVDAARLNNMQAARLAVMLPAPKRFEQSPRSPYLNGRAATIAARMGAVELP
ncbi:monofunctional biosynthetic peptidoglycan transglycosylase [Aquabacterium fontiphilum]|uniref:transglycosylase domain-containing protein n=1 Tax=Aquabacterium fontiphilum TaxID=450365 RepID=UPI0013780DAF|nr:transglycosylase domain-containing protein [Aquabacterium fontiphilum]NBD20828.1 monofunctional biosynthetic peptidoglycan transglycosylase [Aquabacterium fontiphilum]